MESAAEVWGMHNRSLLYSLWQLIWRPGYFISDYINGKRQVSFPPVKMLVIMGVIGYFIDYLFKAPDATKVIIKTVESGSPLVKQFFSWFESNPGWGWLSIACFFLIPTWCLFRYSPSNTKHSLPQGFFIQVFMSIQVLIVDNLADFFGSFFYIMVPMCYFYAYKQLFGYGVWGNFWRVLTLLFSAIMFAILAMSITELLTLGPEKTFVYVIKRPGFLILYSVGPMLVGMFISKMLAKRKKEKAQQQVTNNKI